MGRSRKNNLATKTKKSVNNEGDTNTRTILNKTDELKEIEENGTQQSSYNSTAGKVTSRGPRRKKHSKTSKSIEEMELKSPCDLNKMNAFKFMMDSRYKSIGQNSDGKCMSLDETSSKEILENIERKTKQKIKFKMWATSKVSLKRKLQEEEEEAKDIYINDIMEKRSKRLKSLLKVDEFNSKCKEKTKKKIDEKKKPKSSDEEVILSEITNNNPILIDDVNKNQDAKKYVKLAPIFSKDNHKSKKEEVAAKKSFLNSDLPDNLKKKMSKTNSISEAPNIRIFPIISHVQQKDDSRIWQLAPKELIFKPSNIAYNPEIENNDLKFGSITNQRLPNNSNTQSKRLNKVNNVCAMIKQIKQQNPDYPVFKAFKSISEKCGYNLKQKKVIKSKRRRKSNQKNLNENDNIMWTEKYKMKSSNDFIGNILPALELKKWLTSWIENSNRKIKSSSESEFDSDSDSKINSSSGIVLTGPHGSGKTVSVYAIAEELGFNVIELNASSKRTGKRLLQDLQEATQSHQVQNKHENNSNKIESFCIKNDEKVKRSKLCLLLVDDVDLIFEQDDGFITALTQLLQTSKRPIVLIATDLQSVHLQRFINQYPILNFSRITTKTLGIWLQILCLIEGLFVDINSINELFEYNSCDIRKTMLDLQFWIKSGGGYKENVINNEMCYNVSISYIKDDPKIFIDAKEEVQETPEIVHNDCLKTCIGSYNVIPERVDLCNVWMNVRSVLTPKPVICEEDAKKKICNQDLENYVNFLDRLCFSSCVRKKFDLDPKFAIKDSLELKENFEHFDENVFFSEKLTHNLLENSFKLYTNEREINYSMSFKEKSCKKHPSCFEKRPSYEEVILNSISPLAQIDYDNFALDYCSAIRCMAKSEKHRENSNFKRTNRFYSYLHNLGMKFSNSALETLCNTFNEELA